MGKLYWNYKLFVYILVLDMLCTEGFITKQRCVIELMIQRVVELDVVTYSILMDGFCMRDQWIRQEKYMI